VSESQRSTATAGKAKPCSLDSPHCFLPSLMAVQCDGLSVFEIPQAREETELFLCKCERPLRLPPLALILTCQNVLAR